jgi:hypothetical protein
MPDSVAVFIEFVVYVEHGTARIAEHGVNSLLHKAFDQDL